MTRVVIKTMAMIVIMATTIKMRRTMIMIMVAIPVMITVVIVLTEVTPIMIMEKYISATEFENGSCVVNVSSLDNDNGNGNDAQKWELE